MQFPKVKNGTKPIMWKPKINDWVIIRSSTHNQGNKIVDVADNQFGQVEHIPNSSSGRADFSDRKAVLVRFHPLINNSTLRSWIHIKDMRLATQDEIMLNLLSGNVDGQSEEYI